MFFQIVFGFASGFCWAPQGPGTGPKCAPKEDQLSNAEVSSKSGQWRPDWWRKYVLKKSQEPCMFGAKYSNLGVSFYPYCRAGGQQRVESSHEGGQERANSSHGRGQRPAEAGRKAPRRSRAWQRFFFGAGPHAKAAKIITTLLVMMIVMMRIRMIVMLIMIMVTKMITPTSY